MLNIKLKSWLGYHRLGETARNVISKKQKIITLDHNDLAFQLATANDISEILPSVLKSMQAQLDASLPENQQGRLYVLFSNKVTSETFVHHAQDSSPASSLLHAFHQHFTVRKLTPDESFTLKLNGSSLNLFPYKLFDHNDTTIWLAFAFDQFTPSDKQLKWYSSSIQNTLIKGLQAWLEREDSVQSAIKSERAIYAAELHDSLAQVLGYLMLKSSKLEKLCQQPEYEALYPLSETLATYTQCAYHQTRELITASRLTMQSENLSQGVTNSVKEFEQQSAIVFEVDNRLPYNLLAPNQSIQVLYIVRESLSNIVRHSHATHARITLLLKTASLLRVEVEDNGSGIDPDAARSDSFGLQIMQERAKRIGADLSFGRGSQGGTKITLSLELGEHS